MSGGSPTEFCFCNFGETRVREGKGEAREGRGNHIRHQRPSRSHPFWDFRNPQNPILGFSKSSKSQCPILQSKFVFFTNLSSPLLLHPNLHFDLDFIFTKNISASCKLATLPFPRPLAPFLLLFLCQRAGILSKKEGFPAGHIGCWTVLAFVPAPVRAQC